MNSARPSAHLLLCVVCIGLATGAAAQDLTFLHLSDLHVPHAFAQTQETLAAIPTGPIELTPFGVTTPAPSFIVTTGDLNEFSGGLGWWRQYLDAFAEIPLPAYHQLGNHDNTWRCGRPALRELHGGAFYALEQAGVKLIGWDTATPQDPRPSIAEEGIRWLSDEFERTPPEQPVIIFGHHSLDGREFAGAYDRARLLDLLQTRNVVLMLVGHGHGARAWNVEGLDTVMGGSTFGDRPGVGIVSIIDGVLRVAHRYADGEVVGLLEKPLPERSPFMSMSVTPGDGATFAADEPLRWTLDVDGVPVTARWTLNGDRSGEITRDAHGRHVALDPAAVDPGAHTLRIDVTDAAGVVTSRTVGFHRDGGAFDVIWRERVAGSCQGTPLITGGRLFVGDNSGALTIFDADGGTRLTAVQTGGEVRSSPVTDGESATVVFGSADGLLRAIDPGGAERWRFDAGAAIYGSPLMADGRVFVGTEDGDLIALDAETGRLVWRSDAPEYAIEQAPAIGDGAVFAGAWDRHAYALDADTGELRWQRRSAASDREGFVAWYYSPADSPPAFADGNVFFADRGYHLTVFDARSGERLLAEERCLAVAPAAAGDAVYVRHSDHRVSRRAADGSVEWMAEAPTGAVPTPPVEAHGLVWVISNTGVLSALDAQTGELRASQRVTAGLFGFGSPAFDGERVYLADMAGFVTCLAPRWLRP